jgi:hypothetical protein
MFEFNFARSLTEKLQRKNFLLPCNRRVEHDEKLNMLKNVFCSLFNNIKFYVWLMPEKGKQQEKRFAAKFSFNAKSFASLRIMCIIDARLRRQKPPKEKKKL